MTTQMVATPTATATDRSSERLHGVVLCHGTASTHDALESLLVRQRLTILRAIDDRHALALAQGTRPDVIVMAIDESSTVKDALLVGLQQSRWGKSIPVVAIVPDSHHAAMADLSEAAPIVAIIPDTSLDQVIPEIARLLAQGVRTFRRDDPATASVDAVFSEFGLRRRPASWRQGRKLRKVPIEQGDDALSSPIRRIDQQSLSQPTSASGHLPNRYPTAPIQSWRD